MELNKNESKSFFIILLLIYFAAMTTWLIGQNIDVYRYAVVGGIFEVLWLPTILTIILMPFASFYLWIRDKFKKTSKFLYLSLGSILSIFILYYLTRI